MPTVLTAHEPVLEPNLLLSMGSPRPTLLVALGRRLDVLSCSLSGCRPICSKSTGFPLFLPPLLRGSENWLWTQT